MVRACAVCAGHKAAASAVVRPDTGSSGPRCCTGCCSSPLRPRVSSAVAQHFSAEPGRTPDALPAGSTDTSFSDSPVGSPASFSTPPRHRGDVVPRVGRRRQHRRGPPTRPRPQPRLLSARWTRPTSADVLLRRANFLSSRRTRLGGPQRRFVPRDAIDRHTRCHKLQRTPRA